MLFSYIKKTTICAISLVAAFSIQQMVFCNSFEEDAQKVEVIINEIKDIKLEGMLATEKDELSKEVRVVGLSESAQVIWNKIKELKTNKVLTELKYESKKHKTVSQSLTAAFFFAKIYGSLMLKYAQTFFGDLGNFKDTSVDISADLSTYLTKGLTVIGCTESQGGEMSCDGVAFKKADMRMEALEKSIVEVISKARNILVAVKFEIDKDRCGLAFLLSQFKLKNNEGYDVDKDGNISVQSYIEQTLKKIEKDISTTLLDLGEGFKRLILSGQAVTENMTVYLGEYGKEVENVSGFSGGTLKNIISDACVEEDEEMRKLLGL